MINLQNITKSFSDQLLFDEVCFNQQAGERIGLVGRNGSGKSTLFKIIQGQLQADSGEVLIPKGYKLGALEQHISFSKDTVLAECTQVLSEEEKFDFFKAEKILTGLGFSDEDFEKDPYSFSGGFQIRINLCKCLLINPNLLLLDEPTNYLDILSLRWLKSFLKNFSGEVILITHDREFMDSVTTHTMGISRGKVKKIKGKTAKFYEQLQQEDEIYEKTKINHDKKRAHLESFVDRFGAKASKATQAQSKMKQLEKLGTLEDLSNEASMGLKFNFLPCPGKSLLEAKGLSFHYPGGEMLFENLDLNIGAQDRIGIIGKNGKGKSTLLNLIAGELIPSAGTISEHSALKKGHLGQTNVQRLHSSSTVLEEVSSSNAELGHTKIRQICGAMLFTGDLALKKISVLSGGEKNRVMLGKIIANPTNLLLLDEPTNHLDMESIAILTEELKSYKGAVIIVTHSEELLRKICNRLVIFNHKGAQYFQGNYKDFLQKIGWEDELGPNKKAAKPKFSKKELHAKRQEIIKERSKLTAPLKKSIEKYEQEIVGLEVAMEQYNQELSAASEQADNQLILELSQQVGKIQMQIQDAFELMEVAENKLVAAKKKFENELNQLK